MSVYIYIVVWKLFSFIFGEALLYKKKYFDDIIEKLISVRFFDNTEWSSKNWCTLKKIIFHSKMLSRRFLSNNRKLIVWKHEAIFINVADNKTIDVVWRKLKINIISINNQSKITEELNIQHWYWYAFHIMLIVIITRFSFDPYENIFQMSVNIYLPDNKKWAKHSLQSTKHIKVYLIDKNNRVSLLVIIFTRTSCVNKYITGIRCLYFSMKYI